MKVLQSGEIETVACNECDKNECDSFNQHKSNEIQDLLKAHNSPVQDER